MTPVEIIALLVVLVGLIKIIYLLVKPDAWMKIPKAMHTQPLVTTVISLILAAVILYYLLAAMTIVHIFAAMGFFMMIMLMMFSAYGNEFSELADKLMKGKDILKKAWFPTLIWVVLMIWVLVELFA